MTQWYTIPAKFTAEEKRILDILRDVYDMNHNQSLRTGFELFVRVLVLGEYFLSADSKIMKKLHRIGKKAMQRYNKDAKNYLKQIPLKQQREEYEKLTADRTKILSQFDKTFVKNRKRGRKKLARKRGRPTDKPKKGKAS